MMKTETGSRMESANTEKETTMVRAHMARDETAAKTTMETTAPETAVETAPETTAKTTMKTTMESTARQRRRRGQHGRDEQRPSEKTPACHDHYLPEDHLKDNNNPWG